LKVST